MNIIFSENDVSNSNSVIIVLHYQMFAEHAQYRRVNSENVEKIAFLVLD